MFSKIFLGQSHPRQIFIRTLMTTSTNRTSESHFRIGCASGFWGDTPTAAPQLIHHGHVDFIMFDYLSEITMSLLTAAKAKRPEFGYTADFVSHAIGPHLKDIKTKGIRVVSNAGGINPESCAAALSSVAKKAGVELKIAVVTGDDLMENKKQYFGSKDMNSGLPLPQSVHSMNAYLGSGPIVQCLDHGADFVITGRCADSSLALAPLIHKFGWKLDEYDKLATGSLAGHLIECGAQVTGGIFTDWEKSHDWDDIGFPIADFSEDGSFLITKPLSSGGLINVGTVTEQLLYEIGDPRAYVLPDVVCDFTKVTLHEDTTGIRVKGALGKPPTDSYKVSATYLDGFRANAVCFTGGRKVVLKAKRTAEAIINRCRRIFKMLGMQDFSRTHIQVLGSEETYGPHAKSYPLREGALYLSVHHKEKRALEIFAMEVASAGTGMAPGLTNIIGGRPKPNPLLRLHSFLVQKDQVHPKIKMGDISEDYSQSLITSAKLEDYSYPHQPHTEGLKGLKRGDKSYTLYDLAYTRSGDKGDSCNIGVAARKLSYLPYIQEALTSVSVAQYFGHLFPPHVDPLQRVKRYELEGVNALNFVLEGALGGGGVTSLRSDPQGKALGQMLLDFEVKDMPDIESL